MGIMMIAGTEHRRQGCSLQDGKQWGENVGGGGQTVSLPISFEVAFTAVVSADSSWCNASCHITTTTITTMNYQSNKPDIAQLGPVQWLAIGIQPQWGVGAASTNIMLPIPYTKVKFITLATSSMLNPSQGNISVAYHDSTLDSIRFQIRWQGLAAEYTGAWLTLGI